MIGIDGNVNDYITNDRTTRISSGTILLTHTNEINTIYGTFGNNGVSEGFMSTENEPLWPYNWYDETKRTLTFKTDDGCRYSFAPRPLNQIDGAGRMDFSLLCATNPDVCVISSDTNVGFNMLNAYGMHYRARGGSWNITTEGDSITSITPTGMEVLTDKDISFVNRSTLDDSGNPYALYYDFNPVSREFTLRDGADSSFIIMDARPDTDIIPRINVIGLNLCCFRIGSNVVHDIKGTYYLTARLYPVLLNYSAGIVDDNGAYSFSTSKKYKEYMGLSTPEIALAVDERTYKYVSISGRYDGDDPIEFYKDYYYYYTSTDPASGEWYIHFNLTKLYEDIRSLELKHKEDKLHISIELDVMVPGKPIELETPMLTRVNVGYDITISLEDLGIEVPRLLNMHGYYAIRPVQYFTNNEHQPFDTTCLTIGDVISYEGNSAARTVQPADETNNRVLILDSDTNLGYAYAHVDMMSNILDDLADGENVVYDAYSAAIANAQSSNYICLDGYNNDINYNNWYEPILNNRPNNRVYNLYEHNYICTISSVGSSYYIAADLNLIRHDAYGTTTIYEEPAIRFTGKGVYDVPPMGENPLEECIRYSFDYNPLIAGVKEIYVFKFARVANDNELTVGISVVIYELYNKAKHTLGLENRFVKNQDSKFFGYKYVDYRYYNSNFDKNTDGTPYETVLDNRINEVLGDLGFSLTDLEQICSNDEDATDYISNADYKNDMSVKWAYNTQTTNPYVLYPSFWIDDTFEINNDDSEVSGMLTGSLYIDANTTPAQNLGFNTAIEYDTTKPISVQTDKTYDNDSAKIYRNYFLYSTLPINVRIYSVLHKGHWFLNDGYDDSYYWNIACNSILLMELENYSRYEVTMKYRLPGQRESSIDVKPSAYCLFSAMHQNYQTSEFSIWEGNRYIGIAYNGNTGVLQSTENDNSNAYLCMYRVMQNNYVSYIYATDAWNENEAGAKLEYVEGNPMYSLREDSTHRRKILCLVVRVKYFATIVYKINECIKRQRADSIYSNTYLTPGSFSNGNLVLCIKNVTAREGTTVTQATGIPWYYVSNDYSQIEQSNLRNFNKYETYYYVLREFKDDKEYTPTCAYQWITTLTNANPYLYSVSLSSKLNKSNNLIRFLINNYTTSIITNNTANDRNLFTAPISFDTVTTAANVTAYKGNFMTFNAYNMDGSTFVKYTGGMSPSEYLPKRTDNSYKPIQDPPTTLYGLNENSTYVTQDNIIDFTTGGENNSIVRDYKNKISYGYPNLGLYKGNKAWCDGLVNYYDSSYNEYYVNHEVVYPRFAIDTYQEIKNDSFGTFKDISYNALLYYLDYLRIDLYENQISNPYMMTSYRADWSEDKELNANIDKYGFSDINDVPLTNTIITLSIPNRTLTNPTAAIEGSITVYAPITNDLEIRTGSLKLYIADVNGNPSTPINTASFDNTPITISSNKQENVPFTFTLPDLEENTLIDIIAVYNNDNDTTISNIETILYGDVIKVRNVSPEDIYKDVTTKITITALILSTTIENPSTDNIRITKVQVNPDLQDLDDPQNPEDEQNPVVELDPEDEQDPEDIVPTSVTFIGHDLYTIEFTITESADLGEKSYLIVFNNNSNDGFKLNVISPLIIGDPTPKILPAYTQTTISVDINSAYDIDMLEEHLVIHKHGAQIIHNTGIVSTGENTYKMTFNGSNSEGITTAAIIYKVSYYDFVKELCFTTSPSPITISDDGITYTLYSNNRYYFIVSYSTDNNVIKEVSNVAFNYKNTDQSSEKAINVSYDFVNSDTGYAESQLFTPSSTNSIYVSLIFTFKTNDGYEYTYTYPTNGTFELATQV